VPSARGLRICGAYYDYIKDFLGKKGYRRLICRIAPDNAASIHAHARAGFERCGLLWKLVTPRHAFYYADASALVWLRTVIPAGYFKRRGFLRAYNT
jgi:RimJ/RimL family protein N-acetyltransferase